MIFRQLTLPEIAPQGPVSGVSSKFSFKIIKESLLHNTEKYENTDNVFFSDMLAAAFQSLYETDYLATGVIEDGLLSCLELMTGKPRNCEYLGMIVRNEGEHVGDMLNMDRSGVTFYKDHNYQSRVETVADILPADYFKNQALTIFFVAGSQDLRIQEQRVKKASVLISAMLESGLTSIDSIKIILSGRNNASSSEQKVVFSNESLSMRSLLLHKLEDRLNERDMEVLVELVHTEMNSKDTNENIKELVKYLSELQSDILPSFQSCNVFIISSTFHLLQIQDRFRKIIAGEISGPVEKKLQDIRKEKPFNIFYMGVENIRHRFTTADAPYMKFMFQKLFAENLDNHK